MPRPFYALLANTVVASVINTCIWFAVTFWVILFSAALLLLAYWFISFAVGQIVMAATNTPDIVNSAIGVLREATDRILNATLTLPAGVSDTLSASLNSAYKWLAEQGYRILRIWNNDMLGRPTAVLETILAALEQ